MELTLKILELLEDHEPKDCLASLMTCLTIEMAVAYDGDPTSDEAAERVKSWNLQVIGEAHEKINNIEKS